MTRVFTSLPRLGTGLLLLGALTACGYRLVARPPLPGGAERVRVEILTNETSELELGSILAAALSRRAAREDRLSTDSEPSARLVGQVLRPKTGAVAFPPALGGAGLYTQSLGLEIRLHSASGKMLGKARVSGDEPFEAGGGPEKTEANRRRALERLAERLADEAWSALLASAS